MSEKKKFAEFAPPVRTVSIRGKEYPLREMSLAEKIRVIGPVAERINEALSAVSVKRREDGGIGFETPENLSLHDLKVDQIIMGSLAALPEILTLSVPGFKDWDELSESETREPLQEVITVNDFAGFVSNFISLGARVIRLQARS